MIRIFIILLVLILADRASYPISTDNSAVFPLTNITESINERNIVMLTEQWKPINGYEGLYEVSNLGRVKSLPRHWKSGRGNIVKHRNYEIYLKFGLSASGYYQVNLWKSGNLKSVPVHQLVWDAFGNKPRDGRRLQIDHIDGNKTNNHICNLQLLTQRENIGKGYQSKRSLPTGVLYRKDRGKYAAIYWANGKPHRRGYYDTIEDAAKRYLYEIQNL